MKLVAKCSAFIGLSYQVLVKVCNPIPLISFTYLNTFLVFACALCSLVCLTSKFWSKNVIFFYSSLFWPPFSVTIANVNVKSKQLNHSSNKIAGRKCCTVTFIVFCL